MNKEDKIKKAFSQWAYDRGDITGGEPLLSTMDWWLSLRDEELKEIAGEMEKLKIFDKCFDKCCCSYDEGCGCRIDDRNDCAEDALSIIHTRMK